MREVGEFQSALPEYLREFEREGFVAVEGDTIYFCDPVYGEKIEPGEIPRSLQEDEIFKKGTDALRRLIQDGVLVKLWVNGHRGVVDADRLKKEAPLLTDCKRVGLEWGSALGSTQPRHIDEIKFDAMTSKGNGRYVQLVQEWVEGKGVPTVPSDINTHMTTSDDTVVARPTQDILRSRLVQIWSYSTEVDQKLNEMRRHDIAAEEWEQHYLAWSVYQHMRQYLLPAHFGYMVACHEEDLQPGDTIGLVVGSGHTLGVPQKMQWMGIPLADVTVVSESEDNPINEFMNNKAMPYGNLTRQDIRHLAEHGLRSGGY
jgi:hypothetical protein